MMRHLSFIAAVGMCFLASITVAYAQVRADTGSIAIGGSALVPLSLSASHKRRRMNLFAMPNGR